MPEELVPQWQDAPAYFGAFNWSVAYAPELEADDLLGALAQIETEAGGRALLYTGDRDMFQCVGDDVAVLWPVGAKGEPEVIGPAEVHARYGIGPEQVPDFIALRGDPSDGIPGAKGIGEKTARDLLRDHGTLEDLIAAASTPRADLRPRVRAVLADDAAALRDYRNMATLRHVDIARPPDAPTDWTGAAAAARERGMNRLAQRLGPPAARQGVQTGSSGNSRSDSSARRWREISYVRALQEVARDGCGRKLGRHARARSKRRRAHGRDDDARHRDGHDERAGRQRPVRAPIARRARPGGRRGRRRRRSGR